MSQHPLAELLGQQVDHEQPPRPCHEAQIAELQLVLQRYGKNLYSKGDLVTPRANTPHAWPGEPHMVMEMDPNAEHDWSACQPFHPQHGVRLDMRVAVATHNGDIVMFWVESCWFDRYFAQPSTATRN